MYIHTHTFALTYTTLGGGSGCRRSSAKPSLSLTPKNSRNEQIGTKVIMESLNNWCFVKNYRDNQIVRGQSLEIEEGGN